VLTVGSDGGPEKGVILYVPPMSWFTRLGEHWISWVAWVWVAERRRRAIVGRSEGSFDIVVEAQVQYVAIDWKDFEKKYV
jgi:hypothetical protein